MGTYRLICAVSFSFLLLLGIASVKVNSLSLQSERGAFLATHVNSVEELANQIRTTPEVAKRFEMHFGMTAEYVADYIEFNLTMAELENDTSFVMFIYDPEKDVIEGKSATLKKGVKVLVDRSGSPILKLSCGNPLVLRIPPPAIKKILMAEPDVKLSTVATIPEPQTEEVVFETLAEPILPEIKTETVIPEVQIASEKPIVPALIGGASIVPLLLAAAGATVGNKELVPEPGTISVISAGLAFLAMKIGIRRR